MKNPKPFLRLFVVVTVAVIALALRLRAVDKLPIDYDEDDYLRAAQHYAKAMIASDWAEIINYDYNYEHPPLAKLTYGLALLSLPAAPDIPAVSINAPPARSLPRPHLDIARLTSTALGMVEVVVLAVINPLAALLLSINTWQIKYTSQVMIESLPSLTSLLAVLFYLKAKHRWNGWLALSALMLGLTAASKYLYCVVGVAIVIHWLWQTWPPKTQRNALKLAGWLLPVIAWGIFSVFVFYAADPYLWPDPMGRLKKALELGTVHGVQSEQSSGSPVWQTLAWLAGPVPWHPGVFVITLDLYISLLALVGLKRLWQKQPVFALWLAIAVGSLLILPPKLPQYVLIFTAPLSVAAAEGFAGSIWEPARDWLTRKRAGTSPKVDLAERRVARREGWKALPWLVPGLVTLLVIALFPLIYQGAMALTDFNAMSIKDGINGGVWREVRLGLTGQKEAVSVDIFSDRPTNSREVHYAGTGALQQMFTGLLSDVLFFNVLWVVLSVSVQTVLGVSAALMLNRPGVRFTKWWRALFILPWAIPEFVGALVWLRIFDPSFGWLTQVLPPGGTLPSVLNDTNFALVVLLVAAAWGGFPLLMLAATAGLKLIPADSYEAAALDGATAWQKFRYITWPLLMPLLAPALIVRSIFAFNQFYLFWTMQAPFPLVTFATVSYFLFSGYGGSQYAISAAINIFTVVVLVALILVFNRWSRAAEGVTYA